jgi:hypothetical protein
MYEVHNHSRNIEFTVHADMNEETVDQLASKRNEYLIVWENSKHYQIQ